MRQLSMGLAAVLLAISPMVQADDKEPKPRPDPFQEANRRLEEMLKKMGHPGLQPFDVPGLPGGFRFLRHKAPPARLGAEVRTPDGTLADQLDLPKGQGLVLGAVGPNSAAGKAGMKTHDILLELGGKPVSSNPAEFVKTLAGFAADKPLDAVVLRKGTKETLKGVKLPVVKAEAEPPQAFPAFPGFGEKFPFAAPGGAQTTITRNDDKFTALQKDGKLSVTVKGVMDQGRAMVESIDIDEGSGPQSYGSLDKVQEAHRKRVSTIIAMIAGKESA